MKPVHLRRMAVADRLPSGTNLSALRCHACDVLREHATVIGTGSLRSGANLSQLIQADNYNVCWRKSSCSLYRLTR